MKRDLDLIRQILLTRENSEKYQVKDDEFLNFGDLRFINYNIQLMEDAGLIECLSYPAHYEDDYGNIYPFKSHAILRLTNFGHDYLDSVRDTDIYSKTKEKLGDKFSSVALNIVQKVAETIILSNLNI